MNVHVRDASRATIDNRQKLTSKTALELHYSNRYLSNNYEDLARRVADNVGAADADLCERFYEEIANRRFIPAGNTLLAGAEPLSPNCAVLGLLTEENYAERLDLAERLWRAKTGVGFNLSGLVDPVGALRQMSRLNDAIELGHRPKRGNMAVLNASHPRIKEFIACKSRGADIYNFNISVAVDVANPPSPELLRFIADSAWRTGDPGLVFLQRGANYGPNSVTANDCTIEPIVTCVPCGEQFMHAYETCNLGSINLNADTLFDSSRGCVDWARLKQTVCTAVVFLDRVVDLLQFPDARLEQMSQRMRRIGLGVMGWADLLARLALPYNSAEALTLAGQLSHFIAHNAEQESARLAARHGTCEFSATHRNVSLTCIAPTGGITGLTPNRGYAIEPFFSEATRYTYR